MRAGFARSDRVFWLDGGGSRDWSGRRSLVGVLDEDDVSLTFDAARRRGDQAPGGSGRGRRRRTSSRCSRTRSRATRGTRTCTGSAASATPRARTCRRGRGATGRMRSGCGAGTSSSSTTTDVVVSRALASARVLEPPSSDAPDWYAEAFDRVQEQLRAGNTYEVNLTYRDDVGRADDPLATYLRLRATNPAPYAGLLRHRGTHLLSSSPERYATIDRQPVAGDQADQGDHPAGRHRRGRRAPARHAGHRPEVPRREPDDRRPAAQRPVDGLRGRDGGGAEPDGGGVLRERAPAGLDGARPAARRRDDRGRAAGRCSRPGR